MVSYLAAGACQKVWGSVFVLRLDHRLIRIHMVMVRLRAWYASMRFAKPLEECGNRADGNYVEVMGTVYMPLMWFHTQQLTRTRKRGEIFLCCRWSVALSAFIR